MLNNEREFLQKTHPPSVYLVDYFLTMEKFQSLMISKQNELYESDNAPIGEGL